MLPPINALLALLVCLAGCGGDPEGSRLEPGSYATVYDAEKPDVVVQSDVGIGLSFVAVGAKVRVVDDANRGPRGEDGRQNEGIPSYRAVRVNVVEGPLSGHAVEIQRRNLRPAR